MKQKGTPLPSRIARYLAEHALAAVALICSLLALAGSSYAAFTISGSQIRNHSIDPVKLNPRFISGNVRAWAVVGPGGRVIAGAGRPQSFAGGEPGSYEIRWGVRVGRHCASVVTIDPASSPPTEQVSVAGATVPFTAGFGTAYSTGVHRHNLTFVQTFSQSGQPTPLGFDVIVAC